LSSRAEVLAASAAESWAAEWARLTAFAYRNLIMARRNVFFVFELTFWPGVAMLSHGLLTRFLDLTPEMTAFILVGTVALSAVQVCQLDVAYAVGRGVIVWALMAVIGGRAFGFDFLGPGPVRVALFLLGCFLTALVIGLLVCALVLLFGTRAETSAWAAVNFFVMLGGIYYPISVLPGWVQAISAAIPLTYFLDGIRAGYGFPSQFAYPFATGFALSLLYAILAHWALAAAVTRSRRTGLLLKLSE